MCVQLNRSSVNKGKVSITHRSPETVAQHTYIFWTKVVEYFIFFLTLMLLCNKWLLLLLLLLLLRDKVSGCLETHCFDQDDEVLLASTSRVLGSQMCTPWCGIYSLLWIELGALHMVDKHHTSWDPSLAQLWHTVRRIPGINLCLCVLWDVAGL